MKINFLEVAQYELEDAIDYYNYELPGLGDAFFNEVLNALDLRLRCGRTKLIPCNQLENV